ncbi:hypothetical protein BDZ85DRAFT_134584 [Elsinoe ampelina]|uniref:C3H1-type domain-containing protein n=1 Tax=Elsinoe ampelina TaxID=302913 RepID=A0A6A6G8I9_9PEZI|nr:hypothetical protein BDZ85DRAFT_134584 [Elsinoe ampelina]
MEGHQNAHAANAVQQQSAQNLDGISNGLNWTNYLDYPVDQSNNGYDPNWAFNQPEHAATSTSQSMPVYNNWQQSSVTDPMLDPYSRQYSRSPAAQQSSTYSSDFHDPRRTQTSSVYDPALTTSTFQNQQQLYPSASTYPQQVSSSATIAPNALDNGAQRAVTPQRSFASQPPIDQKALLARLPPGKDAGLFSVVDYKQLSQLTGSTRLQGFVNIGQQDFEYPINRTVIPSVTVRRSRNELRKLAAEDPRLLAKLGSKILKKSAGIPKVKREIKLQASSTKLVQTPAGLKTEVVSSDEESSSETDSSDYDSDDEPDEPSPLPAKRDDEDMKACIRYDSIKALWRPKRRVLHTNSIKAGLKDYWEIVRTIRDRWKADTAALKEAEEKGRNSELPLLKSRVKDQRDMMQVAFKAAVEHGHRSILELSSENLPFLLLCMQFLQDRSAKDDANGPLARSILEILSMCITLTEEKVVKTHLRKMLPRYAKKGDTNTQALVTKIENAIKDGTKQAAEEQKASTPGKDSKPQSPVAEKPIPVAKTAPPVAGVKRSLPAGSSTSQPAKRVASGGSSTMATKVEPAKAGLLAKKPVIAANGTAKSATPAAAPVVKTKMTVSKPSSFFNAMQSTAKKPAPAAKPAATSVLANALKQVEKKTAPTVTGAVAQAKAEQAAKSAFSFAGTMANLSKPKDKAPSPKPEQESAPETPEQRKKRLRKEARRGLRVTFKPDSSIEEVRIFTHDPDEELGHDASMTRDVGDVGGEGRMFKQHKDMMDMDEEEDGPGEEDLKPWREPGRIELVDVPDDNYEQYGGAQKVDSPEKKAREDHDANVLLVFYADRNDIPPSPKEPVEDIDMTDTAEIKEFGKASGNVADRDQKLRSSSRSSQQSNGGQAVSSDVASILAALTPQAQQPQPAPAASNNLQQLLAQLTQSQQQPAQAAALPPPPQPVALPPNFANIFAGLGQTQPQQAAAPPPPPQGQNPADFAALFAALQQNPGGPPPPPNFAALGNGFPVPPPGFPFPIPPPQQQAQQQGQQYPFENEERRRWREQQEQGGEQPGNQQQGGQQQWNQNQSQNQNKKKGVSDRRFTQACRFWPLGKCHKGTACTYRHE